MTTRKLVFVPIFGDGCPSVAEQLQTVKAWGLCDEEEDQFLPVHTEPLLQAIKLFKPYVLFNPEREAMIELAPDADVPIEVSVALATLALAPQTLVTQE